MKRFSPSRAGRAGQRTSMQRIAGEARRNWVGRAWPLLRSSQVKAVLTSRFARARYLSRAMKPAIAKGRENNR